MHVLLAFDKFKDSLTAPAACAHAAAALRERHPDWTLDLCPLADGGEGFCEILTRAAGGTVETHTVTGPRGAPTPATIGVVLLARIPGMELCCPLLRFHVHTKEPHPSAVLK